MPNTPPRKHPINIQDAFDDENPALCSDFFELGSILYNDENSYKKSASHIRINSFAALPTMTPALKLNEHDRKALLS